MTAPAEELRAAAEKIRALVRAIEAPDLPDQSWHTEACASEERGDCPCIVAQGVCNTDGPFVQPLYYVADAETPECATYIAAMGPPTALAIAAVFDAWARIGELDPDLLNRVGGAETLAAARTINSPVTAP